MRRILDKRIPTLLGFLLIIVGLVVTTYLVKSGSLFQTMAGPGKEPKNVKTANISEDSFTVSFLTDEEVLSTLKVGKDPQNLEEIVLDDRDQLSQTIAKHKVHSITVRNLDENTKYFFDITSGDENYKNNGVSYSITTSKKIDSSPLDQVPLSGNVIMPDGSNPPEGLVYLSIKGSQILSTYTKPDGSYTIPLNSLRSEDLGSYFALTQDSLISLDVFYAGLSSSVEITSTEINPVPTISLSNNYDFSNEVDTSSESAQPSETFPNIDSQNKGSGPEIISPKTSEPLKDDKPNFEGTALPNEEVEIEIHSDEKITTSVTADSQGKWSFRPTSKLSTGEHTITIKSKDSNGIIKSITKRFTVYASGTQVNQTATPSATLSPTPIISPTAVPSEEAIPTPTVEISSIPQPTLPPTGPSSVIIAGIVGVAAAAAGFILYFLSRGQRSL